MRVTHYKLVAQKICLKLPEPTPESKRNATNEKKNFLLEGFLRKRTFRFFGQTNEIYYWVPFDWERPQKCCRSCSVETKKNLRKKERGRTKRLTKPTHSQQALGYVVGQQQQRQQTSKRSGNCSKKTRCPPCRAAKPSCRAVPCRYSRRENRRENDTGTPKKVTRDRNDSRSVKNRCTTPNLANFDSRKNFNQHTEKLDFTKLTFIE